MSNITVPPEGDMMRGIKQVESMASAYGEAINVLSNTRDLPPHAFESIRENCPEQGWHNLRDAVWDFFATSQNRINDAAESLVDYTRQTYEVDSDNAEALASASDHDEAERP